jgi:ATP/maltotriose-dependent transcriptional regulator MalT
MEDMFRSFAEKVKTLSSAERRILNLYIAGHEIADLPDLVFVSINTVKKHNRNIYQKLGVASRDELMLYIELFRCCDRLDELIDETPEVIS